MTTVRAVTYNIHNGGLDGDSEERYHTQTGILEELQPDVLGLEECSFWDADDNRLINTMAGRLKLNVAAMIPSRIGDGRNFTALLYRPTKFRLVDWQQRGNGVLHHAMIRARLQPLDMPDGRSDFNAIATHLAFSGGGTRLAEVSAWLTDFAGEFPGAPPRSMLLGDLNCARPHDTFDWEKVPQNLHARYRLVLPDGSFGDADLRAIQVLLASGWQDPENITKVPRAATVGYYYANERVPLCLDHILVRGLTVHDYWTYDTAVARRVSDHLPTVLDAEINEIP